MSFTVQKLVWWALQPANLVFLVLCAGVALLWTRKVRQGKVLLTLLLLFLGALALFPVTAFLAKPLEGHFPTRTPPTQVDGIIVLGGAVHPRLTQAHAQPALNDGAERMTTFVELAQRYPEAKLLFTGGSSALMGSSLSEAEVARHFFEPYGLTERVLYEDRSRDTFENALLSQRLATPSDQETWLLVTSALHMPRAVGVFRKVGWSVLPYPVDFRSTGDLSFRPTLDVFQELLEFNRVASEWLALLAFRLLGRTDTLLP